MLGVVRLSGTAPQGTQFQRHDPQALPLESRYHIADQTSAHSVGLDQDQATFRQQTTLLTDSDQPPTRRNGSSEEGPRESEPTGARGAGLATARRAGRRTAGARGRSTGAGSRTARARSRSTRTGSRSTGTRSRSTGTGSR